MTLKVINNHYVRIEIEIFVLRHVFSVLLRHKLT